MINTIKRLPTAKTLLAIAFLFVQIACSLVLPYITAEIVNQGISAGNIAVIWSKGMLMICLSIGSLLGAVCNTFLFSKISYRLGAELRSDVYRQTLRFSKSEFDRFGAASLITRSTNDVTQVQSLVEMGLKFMIYAPVQLVGGIVMTGLFSPLLAAVFLCAVPFLVIATAAIYRFANPLYTRIQSMLDQLNLHFKEGLTGVKVIRAFGKEGAEYAKYRRINQAYTRDSVSAGTIMGFFFPATTVILNVATLVLVWVGGKAIAAGTVEVGAILGAISYSAQILMGFAMLTQVILAVPRGRTSLKRIQEVLDLPPVIRDPKMAAEVSEREISLAFENVDFRFDGAARKALSGIEFTVYGGQTLAIIGSTGAGKSSLVNLVSRFYDVETGQVRLNGVDIRELPQATLRERVSLAPQTSMLFFGTVRSNLLAAKPDATDEELWNALDMAQATEFVCTLDKGLDSAVEKAGGNFSGGQKQRLCIARALLKEADVYLFDNSFSALDFKTDAAVRAAIRGKTKNAVTVLVAQRISTVLGADMIAVLDGGVLVGLGTHEELLKMNAVYRQIVDSQQYEEVA